MNTKNSIRVVAVLLAGGVLDSTTLTIPAHAQMLLPLGGANGLFHHAANELRNAVATMHADTPLFLGASLVQNGSGDARFSVARSIDRLVLRVRRQFVPPHS